MRPPRQKSSRRATRAIVCAAALLLVTSGCARKDRRTPDNTAVVILDAPEVTEADPRYLPSANDLKVSRLVAAGLVALDDPSLEPRLALAESIELENPTSWLVTLQGGLKFSDGTPLTADDVVYTYQSVLDPDMKSFLRSQYEERIERIEKLDERRVRFVLKEPLATFRTDMELGIVSKRAALAAGGRWPDGRVVGAGPFKVESIDPRGITTLVRNEHYHGAKTGIERVQIKTVRDPNARMLVMVGGSADLTQNTLRPDMVPVVKKNAGYRLGVETGPSAILTYLMIQNEDPILSDVRVRRAIAHALDRELLVKAKFAGLAQLATGLLPPTHWAYEPDVALYGFDPERAKRLLDEAGYPDPDGDGPLPRFTLTYKTSADAFRVSIARLIALQLARVGIATDVRSYDFHTFFTDIKAGNYQLASMQTADIVEPDMYTFYFHTSRIPTPEYPNNGNRWRYRNPAADALMERGRRELDDEARKQIYSELQALMARDLPIIPLWHEDNVQVHNVDLTGYELLPNARLAALARVKKEKK